MSRREKASLILEQMRLCLAKQDFIRTQIIAKKINIKFFEDENNEETQTLKLKYYEYVENLHTKEYICFFFFVRFRSQMIFCIIHSSLMMELARHEGWHLQLCRHNRAVLETPAVRDDPKKRHTALSRAVLYLVLAAHEPEQADLTHRLLADKLLDEIPTYK